jgi:hypothetical protein
MIEIRGSSDDATGYGRMRNGLEGAFAQMGVLDQDTAKVVLFASLPTHINGWRRGQYPVLFTMWETDRLPETARETFRSFAQVFVPSEQNLELFSRYHDNVCLAPLGLDDRWEFRHRPLNRNFTFLFCGDNKRKGADLAVRAFKELAKDDPSLRMVMLSRGINVSHPQITVISEKLSAGDEVELYAQANCFLAPSRGEGWGFCPFQAIAQGCPTILTDAHGHKAFSHLGVPVTAGKSEAEYKVWGNVGQWWEPNYQELVGAMKEVVGDYLLHRQHAETNSRVARAMTWRVSADAVLAQLPADALGGSNESDSPWVSPELELFPIRTNQDVRCEIAGRPYVFERGNEVYVVADVKRILEEAHMLEDYAEAI